MLNGETMPHMHIGKNIPRQVVHDLMQKGSAEGVSSKYLQ